MQKNVKKNKQTLIADWQGNKNTEFQMDLCRTLLAANIPLYKIEDAAVIDFITKYTDHAPPSRTLLRTKYVPQLYEEFMQKLRIKVKNKCIWLTVDETTDCEQRLIVNLIFGFMDGSDDEKCVSFLLNVGTVEKATAQCIGAFVNDSLQLLWPDGNQIK